MFPKLKTLSLCYSIFALSATVNNKQVNYGALLVTDIFSCRNKLSPL